jgi:hypothetical protein
VWLYNPLLLSPEGYAPVTIRLGLRPIFFDEEGEIEMIHQVAMRVAEKKPWITRLKQMKSQPRLKRESGRRVRKGFQRTIPVRIKAKYYRSQPNKRIFDRCSAGVDTTSIRRSPG